MPEIGLLPFARVAMDVATAILPTYRSRFSKHQFTQPQLLAILCLMRYEDWTFREAEVRLREHAELRAVLRLSSVPDYSTVYRFLQRLPDDTIESALEESVRRLRRSSRRGRRRACVAVDGTGLAQHAVSTYFIRRIEQHAGGKTRYKHFLKWLIVVDVDRQIILAQRARQGPWCDTRALPGLVDAASRTMPIGVVLADAEFDSEANHRHVRGMLGAHSIIPAKPRRGVPRGGIRYQMYRTFPRQVYGPRAKIETVFSVIKRKLSAKAPGRSLPVQMRQALLLGLAFNLYRLRHRPAPVGCKQSHLKPFRMNTYKKTGEGVGKLVPTSNSISIQFFEAECQVLAARAASTVGKFGSNLVSPATCSTAFPCCVSPAIANDFPALRLCTKSDTKAPTPAESRNDTPLISSTKCSAGSGRMV